MKKKTVVAIVIVACALAWFYLRSSEPAVTAVPAELINRVWIDRLPEKPDQKIHVLVLLGEPQFGQFLQTSAFEGDFAMFEWSEQKGRLEIVVLQTQAKHKMTASVSREDCDGFDYCMKLKGAPRGAGQYISMEDWVVEPHGEFGLAQSQQLVRGLLAR